MVMFSKINYIWIHKNPESYLFRNPTGIYLFKFNSENTKTMCPIYSKLTIKTPERRYSRFSGSLCTQFECGKIRTRITPYTNTFYAVTFYLLTMVKLLVILHITYLITSRKVIIVLLKFLTALFQRITLEQKTVGSLVKL